MGAGHPPRSTRPNKLRGWVPDPEGKDSYPIVTYTWLLVDKHHSFLPIALLALTTIFFN